MMHPNLARVLIERGVIQHGTMLQAYYNTKGISCRCDTPVLGSFRLIGAKASKDDVFFETMLPETNERHRIRCDEVLSVDGMPLMRIAESQSLTREGAPKISIRRKRKIKSESVAPPISS